MASLDPDKLPFLPAHLCLDLVNQRLLFYTFVGEEARKRIRIERHKNGVNDCKQRGINKRITAKQQKDENENCSYNWLSPTNGRL